MFVLLEGGEIEACFVDALRDGFVSHRLE
jgi:hypothetical protein